jgi:hypothetical protein
MILVPPLEHPSPGTLVWMAVAFGLLVVIVTSGLWSTLIHWEAMEKVNSRLPESQKVEALWWGPFKESSPG